MSCFVKIFFYKIGKYKRPKTTKTGLHFENLATRVPAGLKPLLLYESAHTDIK